MCCWPAIIRSALSGSAGLIDATSKASGAAAFWGGAV
jgi:hypothetical protein